MSHLQHTESRVKSTKPVIALIGGAGPDAAVDMQHKLLYAMRAKLDINCDQDYYRVIVDNNTSLPDRGKALLSRGPCPLLDYLDSAKKLEAMGGNVLLISCNTAHIYFDEIQRGTKMKMINMIEETARFIRNTYDGIRRVGLVSTVATFETGLYHDALAQYNIEVAPPSLKSKTYIEQAIYGIKAGFFGNIEHFDSRTRSKLYNIYKGVSEIYCHEEIKLPKKLLQDAIKEFFDKGIEHIVLGCTEIPLVLNKGSAKGCILIDPAKVLANVVVDYVVSIENLVNKTSQLA